MTSPAPEADGFRWPAHGLVTPTEWVADKECGRGLHGMLWGEGDAKLLCWDDDAKWIVAEIDLDEVIELDGKIKVPRAFVVFVGDRHAATDFLASKAPGHSIIGSTATAGYAGTATAGNRGTATAGDDGTATAGDDGTILIWWRQEVSPGKWRRRVSVGYVGEGIESGKRYRLDQTGAFVLSEST